MHILNIKKLEELFLGNREKVDMLIASLEKRLSEWQTEADQALATDDPMAIRKICHKIRGAAGTITAEQLEDAARRWGEMAKQQRHEDLQSGHTQLSQAIAELKRTIDQRSAPFANPGQ